MKRWLLVVFASLITYIAFAQETYTYTHTKTIENGVEYEGTYAQYKIVFNENLLKSTLLGVNFRIDAQTYIYDHQENGWSIYYYGTWNNWTSSWNLNRREWYSVSPDKNTINMPQGYQIYVLKHGVQNKSVGTMYE